MTRHMLAILLGVVVSLSVFSVQAEKEEPTADEIAKELANPNTPLASLTFKTEFRTFKGDLLGADDQNGIAVLFQPSMPFPLDNGGLIFFRPAIPLIHSQPVPTGPGQFDDKSGIGDIAFDLAYAPKRDDGLLIAYGAISSLPTATDDALGSDRFTLGPEYLIGKLTREYILGAHMTHQWDIGGSGDQDINISSVQLFGVLLPGDGWNYGSSPTMTYNWETEEATIPLNFNFGKTVIWGGRPWKLSMQINYYVEQPDEFGPEWMIGINITPVVENALVSWFK